MQSIISKTVYITTVLVVIAFIYIKFYSEQKLSEVPNYHYGDVIKFIDQYPSIADNSLVYYCFEDEIIDVEEYEYIYNLYLNAREDAKGITYEVEN